MTDHPEDDAKYRIKLDGHLTITQERKIRKGPWTDIGPRHDSFTDAETWLQRHLNGFSRTNIKYYSHTGDRIA